MSSQPILIAGQWRAATSRKSFAAENPATGERLPEAFPVSEWPDCDQALAAAAAAARDLRHASPAQIASFLNRYAERIEARATGLVAMAHQETALPKAPRLAEVELPRTTDQLRQAAAAVLDGSWCLPTIDTKLNLRSVLAPLGPVLIFGPNNFPFAFNGVSGGDFAAAIAAGNPVIAKAHPCHPGTTRLLAEAALAAVRETGLPPATVQMIYQLAPEDGVKLVADKRMGAVGFTGSRMAGLKLKAAADVVGKPFYAELSSLNPIVILPGAMAERGEKLAAEYSGSCLMASGQLCTSPGLTMVFAGGAAEQFITDVKAKLENAAPAALLSAGGAHNLAVSVATLQAAGAELVAGGAALAGNRFANTLLRVTGEKFLASPEKLQTEAFGNASLIMVLRDMNEAVAVLDQLEGNLTGSIFSDTQGGDDASHKIIAAQLRQRVGRLLNDKMPTGVAVSAAMNHGGPFPATGHPGFTAVGIPASLRRFAMLQCFDNVRPARLPASLQNNNPNGNMWRLIDGRWSQADVNA